MLNAMRKQASSLSVKILLGALIVSFAVWGIGDVFLGGHGGATVAEVGNLEVDVDDVNREFEQNYQQFNRSLGGAIDRQSAISFGLLDQAVQSQIAERLVDQHSLDLGLGVADDEIRAVIQRDPTFGGPGRFNRQSMEFVLRQQGLTETDLIGMVRDDIRRHTVLSAMTRTQPVSTTLTKQLSEFRNQERLGSVLLVDANSMPVDEPDDDMLAAYLSENQADYEAPEFRSGVAISLEPEDLVAEIAVDDNELQAMYERRSAEFTTPEQRELSQLLAPDLATAEEVAAALQAGGTIAAVSEEFAAKGVSYSSIGPVRQTDLPAAIGEAAFGMTAEAISAPVESDFGFHIFKPIEINEGSQVPFAEVREELAREVALRQAQNQLPDLAARLDDEIAAGETLETAAETLQLTLLAIPLTSGDGQTMDDSVSTVRGDMLAAMFGAEVGEVSLLEESASGGYFMYRVDTIEPARPLSLEEAIERLTAEWTVDQRQQASAKLAQRLADQASEGRQFETLIEALPPVEADAVELLTTQALKRNDSGAEQGLSRAVVAALFAHEPSQAAAQAVEVPLGMAVVRTDEVISAEGDVDLAAIEAEIARSRQTETLSEYESYLRQIYPVSVNPQALQSFYQDEAGY